MTNVDNSIWYSYQPILSHKKFLNIIVGERGVGKSFGAKYIAKRDLLFKNRETVWVRRTQEELEETYDKFEGDISEKFPDRKFVKVNYTSYLLQENEKTGDKFFIPNIYFIPLSCETKFKSASYHKVFNLVFDEFATDGKYLKNEMFKFCNLIETVFRHRNGRIFLIGNSFSVNSPYFEYFGIKMDKNKRFTVGENWIVENCDNEAFRSFKKETAVGKLLGNTEYARHSINNEFILDDTANVIPNFYDGNRFAYNLVLHGRKIGVYYCNNSIYFGEPELLGKNKTVYFDDVTSGIEYIPMKDTAIKFINNMVLRNKAVYCDIMTKNEITLLCRKIAKNY